MDMDKGNTSSCVDDLVHFCNAMNGDNSASAYNDTREWLLNVTLQPPSLPPSPLLACQYPELPPSLVIPSQPPSCLYLEHWNDYPNLEVNKNLCDLKVHLAPPKQSDWLFYEKTNKVFIKPNTRMTTNFSFQTDGAKDLHLRAMLVNTIPEHKHLAINRCANHRSSNNTLDVPSAHILKCYHTGAKYFGKEKKEFFGDRLSVVVPLKRPILKNGVASESIQWEFLCQNVCAEGIKRKPVAVVFTLENDSCEILGKVVMPVKVCVKPGRDMKKEVEDEAKSTKPRKRKSKTVSHNKKPTKKPSSYSVKLILPDKKAKRHILDCARNAITNAMAKDRNTPAAYYRRMIRKNEQQA